MATLVGHYRDADVRVIVIVNDLMIQTNPPPPPPVIGCKVEMP